MSEYFFLPIFVLIHLVVFMIYGNAIATSYQEIKRKKKILKIPEINTTKTLNQITFLEKKISRSKKVYPFLLMTIFGIHLLLSFEKPMRQNPLNTKWAYLVAGIFLIFYFIVNFLKGAGTIDKNKRMEYTDNNW